jgi:cobalt-zinc-cadmium efflux system protein
VALLADAGHNLGDVLSLLAAWWASVLVAAKPSGRYTYGLRSSSMLAALFNAVTLLVATGGIAWEAARRLVDPQPAEGVVMMAVAAAGVAINGVTAWMFVQGAKTDLNLRAAFAHMLTDALVSLAVVAAGAAILFTGWLWLDPAVSLAVAVVIVAGTWGLLRDAVNMVLAAAPPGIDPAEVRGVLEALPGVERLHDLHIWPMSTTETALTCHLIMPGGHPGDGFLSEACETLHERFGIGHATIQVEMGDGAACRLEPEHVV